MRRALALSLVAAGCGTGELVAVLPDGQSAFRAAVVAVRRPSALEAVAFDPRGDQAERLLAVEPGQHVWLELFDPTLEDLDLSPGPIPPVAQGSGAPLPAAQQTWEAIVEDGSLTPWSRLERRPEDLAGLEVPRRACPRFEQRLIVLDSTAAVSLIAAVDDATALAGTLDGRLFAVERESVRRVDGRRLAARSFYSAAVGDGHGVAWVGDSRGGLWRWDGRSLEPLSERTRAPRAVHDLAASPDDPPEILVSTESTSTVAFHLISPAGSLTTLLERRAYFDPSHRPLLWLSTGRWLLSDTSSTVYLAGAGAGDRLEELPLDPSEPLVRARLLVRGGDGRVVAIAGTGRDAHDERVLELRFYVLAEERGRWVRLDVEPPAVGTPRVAVGFDDGFVYFAAKGAMGIVRADAAQCEVRKFTEDEVHHAARVGDDHLVLGASRSPGAPARVVWLTRLAR